MEFKSPFDKQQTTIIEQKNTSQSDSEEKSHPSRDADDNFDEIMATFDKVKNQKFTARDNKNRRSLAPNAVNRNISNLMET